MSETQTRSRLTFITYHPAATIETMGYIPSFLSAHDGRPAREQINQGYAFAGGWQPQSGWTLLAQSALKYPGDPPLLPLCELQLRNERVVLYRHDIVAIFQPDRSFEVCRLD